MSAAAVTLVCDEKKPGVHPDCAPIWQKRLYDFNVRIEQKQIEKLRLHPPQPDEARTSGGALGVEQLSFLPLSIPRDWIAARVKSQEWPMEIKGSSGREVW